VRVGFGHATTDDPTFGDVSFYSTGTSSTSPANVVTIVHGSQITFTNDGSGVPHTASGLGTGGFPASFDNTGGTTQTGTTIDGSLTWSTGTLQPGATSIAFTVGPPADYYFGCFYHYNSNQMRDVIVSQ
jgi:plastocyanin